MVNRVEQSVYEYVGRGDKKIYVPIHTLDSLNPTQILVHDAVPEPLRSELITVGRINQAKKDARRFNLSTPEITDEDRRNRMGSGEWAFLVHARDISEIAKQFPYLTHENARDEVLKSPQLRRTYSNGHLNAGAENYIRERFRGIPPFRAARITGLMDDNGAELRGWLVIATVTPEQMASEDKDERRWAKDNILKATKLAWMLGADIVGLGAMTAMMTNRGRLIRQMIPELHVTTGHSYTLQTMNETTVEVVNSINRLCEEENKIKLEESTMAILGAAGSIGSSSAEHWIGRVGRLILVDTERQRGILDSFIKRHQGETSTQFECITVVNENDAENYTKALKQSDIILAATILPQPYIKREWLKWGTIYIDDSAPFSVEDGVVEKVGGMTFHVVANVPDGMSWNFSLGPKQGSYGCGAEVASLAAQGLYDRGIVGKVTPESIDLVTQAATATGFGLGPLQSFGKIKTDNDFAKTVGVRLVTQAA